MIAVPRLAVAALFEAVSLDQPGRSLWGEAEPTDEHSRSAAAATLQSFEGRLAELEELLAALAWPSAALRVSAEGLSSAHEDAYLVGSGSGYRLIHYAGDMIVVSDPMAEAVLVERLAAQIGSAGELLEEVGPSAALDIPLRHLLVSRALLEFESPTSPIDESALAVALERQLRSIGEDVPESLAREALNDMVETGMFQRAAGSVQLSEVVAQQLQPVLSGHAMRISRVDTLSELDRPVTLANVLASEREMMFFGPAGDRWLMTPAAADDGPSVSLLRVPQDLLVELLTVLIRPREYPARTPVEATDELRVATASPPVPGRRLIGPGELSAMRAALAEAPASNALAATLLQPERCLRIEAGSSPNDRKELQISCLGEWAVAWSDTPEGTLAECAPRVQFGELVARQLDALLGSIAPADSTFAIGAGEFEAAPTDWRAAPESLKDAAAVVWFAAESTRMSNAMLEGESLLGICADEMGWLVTEQDGGHYLATPFDPAATIEAWEKSPRAAIEPRVT